MHFRGAPKCRKYDQIKHQYGDLVPIPVNTTAINSYQEVKRFNVIFPSNILKAVDNFRKKIGLKRSTFLQKAAEEYMQQHRG